MHEDAWLELHVIGSNSKGEGIVIRLPDGAFGVVDCCFRGRINDPDSNPMISFLKSRGVTKLKFVCLTHPHDDHYFGLSQIIEVFEPSEFWLSGAMDGETLRQIVRAELIDAERFQDDRASSQLAELQKIFKLRKTLSKRKKNSLTLKFAGVQTTLYPSILPRKPSFSIVAFSPCGQEKSEYESSLKSCFENGEFKQVLPRLEHNRISLGLIIDTESFSVVLGGDVEKKNWNYAIESFGEDWWQRVSLIKISHHGSSNGMCDKLWETIGKVRKPVAVVTGYSPSRLPESIVVRTLLNNAEVLYCTHEASLPQSFVAAKGTNVSQDSIEAISAYLNSDKRISDLATGFRDIKAVGDASYGRCSYYFSKNGNLTTDVNGNACQVTQLNKMGLN
jgi:beta-lactamase superfamily II metal-dependent hydrolase